MNVNNFILLSSVVKYVQYVFFYGAMVTGFVCFCTNFSK